jgi:hypothetical protein
MTSVGMTRHLLTALLLSTVGACAVDAGDEPVTELTAGDGKTDGSFSTPLMLTADRPAAVLAFTCSELVHCSADIDLRELQSSGTPELTVEITRESDGAMAVFEVAQVYGGGQFVFRHEQRHADLFADGEYNNILHVRSWDPHERFRIRVERHDWDATQTYRMSVAATWR